MVFFSHFETLFERKWTLLLAVFDVMVLMELKTLTTQNWNKKLGYIYIFFFKFDFPLFFLVWNEFVLMENIKYVAGFMLPVKILSNLEYISSIFTRNCILDMTVNSYIYISSLPPESFAFYNHVWIITEPIQIYHGVYTSLIFFFTFFFSSRTLLLLFFSSIIFSIRLFLFYLFRSMKHRRTATSRETEI